MSLSLREVHDRIEWNSALKALPDPHILQCWEWGVFKSRHYWGTLRLLWERRGSPVAAAQVLVRRGTGRKAQMISRALPTSVAYVPKGPTLDWADAPLRQAVLSELEAVARRERAIFVKIDPDVVLGTGVPGSADEAASRLGAEVQSALTRRRWRSSSAQVQFRNTAQIDLTTDEAGLLAAMKQKTRYNVRLAEKKGVRVRAGGPNDLDLLYRLYAETSVRDGFVIRTPAYYRDAWGTFVAAGLAQPFIAEVEGEAVGAIVVYRFGARAWYMYGMSRPSHREKMPNHRLQWEAMRWAKAQGCRVYDFWGAPDEFTEDDPLWGVWKFKAGFGGRVIRHIGAWDYAASPLAYYLYMRVMPRALAVMRRRGRAETARALVRE